MLKQFLAENPKLSGPWRPEVEYQFQEYRAARAENAKFLFETTSMKRMIAVAASLRIKSGIPVPEEWHQGVSLEECLAWRRVPTATFSKVLPAFRRMVKGIYGVRLAGCSFEWSWTVPIGQAECTTAIKFAGYSPEFSYERYVTFPDSPAPCIALSWEEHLGELPPKWELMTGDTITPYLELFFTFCREMEDRVRTFAPAAV